MKLSSEARLKRRKGVKGGTPKEGSQRRGKDCWRRLLRTDFTFSVFSATSCDGNALRLKMCPLPDMEGRMEVTFYVSEFSLNFWFRILRDFGQA